MKTIILMRHSEPIRNHEMNTQDLPLSKDGLLKMQQFVQNAAFQEITSVYSSEYLRARETAAVLSDHSIVDQRFNERWIGETDDKTEHFWLRQYQDLNYRTVNGESLYQVQARMNEGIQNVLDQLCEGQKAVIVSHATAICSYFFQSCSIQVIDEKEKIRCIQYQGKEILRGKITMPCAFQLEFEKNLLTNLTKVET